MKISIVTSLYRSEPYVNEFYKRAKAVVEKLGVEYEIIFVNDASPDNSLGLAVLLSERDNKVSVIDLSRNFGQHKAIMTGLRYATGDLMFILDSDLEEDPKLLELFYNKLQETDCDVVYGQQKKRKGGWFERITGHIFYKIFNWVANCKLPRNLITMRLMKKNYVENLLKFTEQEIFMAGLWHIAGFTQIPIIVTKHNSSCTTYSIRKKISLFINAITSFSNRPLIFIFYTGLLICGVAAIYILHLLIRNIFFSTPISGWSSLIVSLWFLGGLIILFLGIIGIYISKIFIETKQRPYTIIKKIYCYK